MCLPGTWWDILVIVAAVTMAIIVCKGLSLCPLVLKEFDLSTHDHELSYNAPTEMPTLLPIIIRKVVLCIIFLIDLKLCQLYFCFLTLHLKRVLWKSRYVKILRLAKKKLCAFCCCCFVTCLFVCLCVQPSLPYQAHQAPYTASESATQS